LPRLAHLFYLDFIHYLTYSHLEYSGHTVCWTLCNNQQINQSSNSLFLPCIMQFGDNTQLYFLCNSQL